MDLSLLQYFYITLAAFLVGFTKTSVGGVGILAVLLMALAIPGKASPGVLLPMLIAADIMVVIYFRRSCQWRLLLGLLPLVAVGVVLGYGFLSIAPEANFTRLIGWITLTMLGLDLAMSEGFKRHIKGRFLTGITGMLAGAASMVANAAGPIFGLYLLQMWLKKAEFVGTRSWFFLLMNLIKLPFAVVLGLVNPTSLSLNIWFLPVIVLGAYLGRAFLGYINISTFTLLIRIAVLVAALQLIIS